MRPTDTERGCQHGLKLELPESARLRTDCPSTQQLYEPLVTERFLFTNHGPIKNRNATACCRAGVQVLVLAQRDDQLRRLERRVLQERIHRAEERLAQRARRRVSERSPGVAGELQHWLRPQRPLDVEEGECSAELQRWHVPGVQGCPREIRLGRQMVSRIPHYSRLHDVSLRPVQNKTANMWWLSASANRP